MVGADSGLNRSGRAVRLTPFVSIVPFRDLHKVTHQLSLIAPATDVVVVDEMLARRVVLKAGLNPSTGATERPPEDAIAVRLRVHFQRVANAFDTDDFAPAPVAHLVLHAIILAGSEQWTVERNAGT